MTLIPRAFNFFAVLHLIISEIKNKSGKASLALEEQDCSDFEDLGCRAPMKIEMRCTSIQENYWLTLKVITGFLFECRRCGGPRPGKTAFEFKIMIQMGAEKGICWQEEESGSFDEYWVQIGPEVEKIPLFSLIREQVLLNCNSARPQDGFDVVPCAVCENEPITNTNGVRQERKEIDSRWEKLKSLLDKGEGH